MMINNIESLGLRILLVRHGETDWNQTHRFQGRIDIPLNKEGKKQAHALALALKDEPLVAIYSSPLLRAIETARFIKEFHPSTPFFEEGGLTEMDLGEFDGMEAGYCAAHYQDFFKTWRSTPACLSVTVTPRSGANAVRHFLRSTKNRGVSSLLESLGQAIEISRRRKIRRSS